MNRPLAISLSPNADREYVRPARLLLFVHSYWKDRSIISRASNMLAAQFPGHFVSLASSGRQALYDTLRALDIGEGDAVVVQAFTCIAVPEPVLWAGATPIYADIREGTYNIDPEDVRKKITDKTKAIIVQHTFGIPGPIEEIIRLAKERNIFVIEDCAHALPASLHGKPLGTFGDAAILSFGRDKCISSIFGGAVITRQQRLTEKIAAIQKARPLPPKTWVAQQLVHPVFFQHALPWYFAAGIGKAALVCAQRIGLLSRAVAMEERKNDRPPHIGYAYSPALALLLIEQLKHLEAIALRRREIVDRYRKEITSADALLPSFDPESSPAWLRFPLQVPHAREMLLDARTQDMLLGDWYDAPLVPASADYRIFQYRMGMCPQAERACRRVINLPTYPSLTDTQVTKIISFVNGYGN